MKTKIQLSKNEAIAMLGGTPASAASAMGYKTVQGIYMLPALLTVEMSDRVRGAWLRLNPVEDQPAVPRRVKRRSWLVRGGRLV